MATGSSRVNLSRREILLVVVGTHQQYLSPWPSKFISVSITSR